MFRHPIMLLRALVVFFCIGQLQANCPADFITGPKGCFKEILGKPVTQREAQKACQEAGYSLPEPESLAELTELVSTLKEALELKDTGNGLGPGFWMIFERNQEAPEGSEGFEAIRKDKSLFTVPGSNKKMAEEMWRKGVVWRQEPDQPGDYLDARDERCVAVRDFSQAFADDFVCEGTEVIETHFAICYTRD